MKNSDLRETWAYHDATKHSYRSVRANAHFLDWENQPLPFKVYSDLEPIPLPRDASTSGVAALNAIAAAGDGPPGAVPDLPTLAQVLYFSAGITRRRRHPGGEVLFRAAACTGALYHIDLYLVTGDLPGLGAGVYHFGPHDFALRKLRDGDYREVLARASGGEPAVSYAPVVVASASTFWRNAWKYQSRAYRHCYWDNGTILANLLAVSAARGLVARVVLGFEDRRVSELLGLDAEKEAVLSLVALGSAPEMASRSAPEMAPLSLRTAPLSRQSVDYPLIRKMHEASSLGSEEEVMRWREAATIAVAKEAKQSPPSAGTLWPLKPLPESGLPRDSIEEVILRRGSTRQFAREPISFSALSTMLERSARGIPADCWGAQEGALNDIYLIVNAVDGIPPGAYLFDRASGGLELLKEGQFRRDAGYLGLEQELPADASADLFFLTDLDSVLERRGNRGYRAAELEASITAGKLYLAAYAQKLGASGLTFYDDEVTAFFSPRAAQKSVMFLLALGKSTRREKT